MEVDPPENTQKSVMKKQQRCGSRTDGESRSSHSLTYLHKTIDNPQTCIVQRQIDSNTAKMLVILQNGEQRLITFDIPNEDCTVQDLLDEVNITLCPKTSVSLVTDKTLQINYVVEAGPGTYLYPEDGSEQSDSNPSLDKVATTPEGSSPVFSSSEENSKSSLTQQEEAKYVDGKLAACPNCGITLLPDDVETVPMTIGIQAKKQSMLAVDTSYKKNNERNRPLKRERETSVPSKRGRGRGRPSANAKLIKESECLIISSDEDDQREGKFKKSQMDNSNTMSSSVGHIQNQPEVEMISDEESVTTNSSVSSVNERNVRIKEGVKGGGRYSYFQNMSDGLIQATHTSFMCRTVRIGSYKYIPQERVVISQTGVKLRVPLLEDSTNFVPLEVKFKDIVKVLIHFGNAMPVLFLYTTFNAGSMIREMLEMQDPTGPYYDPAGKDHTHKRITLLPELMTEKTKLILKALFTPNNLLEELSCKEANDILIRASPKHGQWFEEIIVTREREELSKLLVRLMNATKGERNIILPVLTFPTQEERLLPNVENNVDMKTVKSEAESKKKAASDIESRNSISGSAGAEENTEAMSELQTRNSGCFSMNNWKWLCCCRRRDKARE